MNFMKGVMVGSIITAGTIMMYSDEVMDNKKKMLKKGKQFVKKFRMAM